jgi:hypothetical protein
MEGNVVLVRKKWAHAAKLQDAFAAIHRRQLVNTHQLLSELLIVE